MDAAAGRENSRHVGLDRSMIIGAVQARETRIAIHENDLRAQLQDGLAPRSGLWLRSIVAWHQSQADVRAGNDAVQRHDGYVNDVQRFGTIIKIFEVRGRTKVRRDDEIAGAKRARDQFDRVAVFQRRAQQCVDQSGQR